MKLLQNPLVKVAGIVVIIYFALFANKNNPQSLGNRLSAERLKKDFSEIEQKGKFIAGNVQAARSYAKAHEEEVARNPTSQNLPIKTVLEIKDVDPGVGKDPVICGAEIEAFISLRLEKTDLGVVKNLNVKPEQKIVVGSKKDWFLEKNVLGMKKGGVREIKVPQGFKEDAALEKLLQENNAPLVYQIILKDILQNPLPNSTLNCND